MNHVFKTSQGNPATTSRLIATKFGKQHKHVLRAIDEVVSHIPDCQGPTFGPTLSGAIFHQVDEWVNLGTKRQNNRYFVLNVPAFTLLSLGFTGKDAAKFKDEFLEEFNNIREELRELKGETASPVNLLEHTARPVQIQNSKDINHYHKQKSGMYKMIDHNRKNCEIHTGFRPCEIVKAAKDDGMPSKWRSSAKEVLRHTAPHKAAAMSLADYFVKQGGKLETVSEITKLAEGVFKTMILQGYTPAQQYLA